MTISMDVVILEFEDMKKSQLQGSFPLWGFMNHENLVFSAKATGCIIHFWKGVDGPHNRITKNVYLRK